MLHAIYGCGWQVSPSSQCTNYTLSGWKVDCNTNCDSLTKTCEFVWNFRHVNSKTTFRLRGYQQCIGPQLLGRSFQKARNFTTSIVTSVTLYQSFRINYSINWHFSRYITSDCIILRQWHYDNVFDSCKHTTRYVLFYWQKYTPSTNVHRHWHRCRSTRVRCEVSESSGDIWTHLNCTRQGIALLCWSACDPVYFTISVYYGKDVVLHAIYMFHNYHLTVFWF